MIARRLASFGLMLTVIALLASPLAAAPSARDVALRVQRVYDGAKTFRADFRQTYRIKMQNVKKVSTGKVAFAKPGKISFRYDAPNGNRVVADGRNVKVYDEGARQMYRTKVNRSQYPAALAFLTGRGQLLRDYRLRLLDASAMKVDKAFVLEALPKKPTPAYKKLLLYIDGATAHVRRVLILDAQGNRNRFDFSKPKINGAIAASEFRFEPPAGTTIVKP
jgi:outer membrane lipoprotein carrier protein